VGHDLRESVSFQILVAKLVFSSGFFLLHAYAPSSGVEISELSLRKKKHFRLNHQNIYQNS